MHGLAAIIVASFTFDNPQRCWLALDMQPGCRHPPTMALKPSFLHATFALQPQQTRILCVAADESMLD